MFVEDVGGVRMGIFQVRCQVCVAVRVLADLRKEDKSFCFIVMVL